MNITKDCASTCMYTLTKLSLFYHLLPLWCLIAVAATIKST